MTKELERLQKEIEEKYVDQRLDKEDHLVKRMKAQERILDEEYGRMLQLEEDVKADAIHEIETKNKVLESVGNFLEKQKSVLCITKLTFNFDKGVKDVRSSLFHIGAPRDHRNICKQS